MKAPRKASVKNNCLLILSNFCLLLFYQEQPPRGTPPRARGALRTDLYQQFRTHLHTFTGFHSTHTGCVIAQAQFVWQAGGSQNTHLPNTFLRQLQQLQDTPLGQHT